MVSISNAISAYCVQHKIIDPNDEIWLRYGIEKRLSTAVILFPFLILSIVLTDLSSGLSFLLAFKQIRGNASGYHSSTVLHCFLVSLVLELLFLIGLYPKLSVENTTICNLINCLVIFTLAPYNHPNMGLSQKEISALRHESQRAVVLLSIISTTSSILGLLPIAKGISTGVTMASFSLCLAYINDWRKKI